MYYPPPIPQIHTPAHTSQKGVDTHTHIYYYIKYFYPSKPDFPHNQFIIIKYVPRLSFFKILQLDPLAFLTYSSHIRDKGKIIVEKDS